MDLQEFLSQNPAWQSHPDLILRPPSPAELSAWFPEASPELLQRSDELIRHCGLSLTRGALYSHIRLSQKSSDRWAAMLALQSPPGLKDNATFMAGRKPWYEHADPRYVEKVKGILKAKGVELTSRHEYCPELARYTGDPEAVLPHGQERDHIKKICEKRGWACHGAVECEHRQPDTDPHQSGPRMAEDLIRQKAQLLTDRDPSLKKLSRQDLRAKVLDKFGPST